MNLRVKLSLIFASIAVAIVLVLMYPLRFVLQPDETYEVDLLREYTEKFVSELPSYNAPNEVNNDLLNAVTQLGLRHVSAVLLDKGGRIVAVGSAAQGKQALLPLVEKIWTHEWPRSSGRVYHSGNSYTWYALPIPNSAFILLMVHHIGDNSTSKLPWDNPSSMAFVLTLTIALAIATAYGVARVIERVRALKNELDQHSLYDELTGLPNRALLSERLKQLIFISRRNGQSFALVRLDLDRFGNVNDTLGVATGDALLKQIAARLQSVLRESDSVTRPGSDEFALVLHNVDENHVAHVTHKILRALDDGFSVDGHNLFVRANAGVALFPQHGEDEITLMQCADVALRISKKASSDVILYNKKHDDYSIKHLALINDLHTAIAQGHFELHYQPKIRLADCKIAAVEALLRWKHPQRGLVAPDEFIPVAEQTGLIHPLTHWVLNRALADNTKLRERGYALDVSVNISMYNLLESDFDRKILDVLSHTHVAPPRLELEITETAMMSNPARIMNMLLRLDAIGVRLSIDDFGTGYSSLSYLKQLPVDELKIDKSFVLQMHEENEAAVVRAIIGLAHDLGLSVVAEGVEVQALFDTLRDLGCDTAQGHYTCRPVPLDDLLSWLDQNKENKVSDPGRELIWHPTAARAT